MTSSSSRRIYGANATAWAENENVVTNILAGFAAIITAGANTADTGTVLLAFKDIEASSLSLTTHFFMAICFAVTTHLHPCHMVESEMRNKSNDGGH